MNNQHVLFYSNNCPHCQEFIQLIQNSKFHNQFRKLCVENMARIPNGIHEVPTIIVPNYNIPLSGDNVFKWFQQNTQAPPPNALPPSIATKTQSNPTPDPVLPSRNIPNQIPKATSAPSFTEKPPSLGDPIDEPSPFGIEMSSGFSDIYSYIDDGRAGKPLVHSFEYLDNSSAHIGSGKSTESHGSNPSNGGNFSQQTKPQSKGDILNKKYEDFMNSRNNDPVCNKPVGREI